MMQVPLVCPHRKLIMVRVLYPSTLTQPNPEKAIDFLLKKKKKKKPLIYYRSARTSGFFQSKGRVTIAWPMKTFISRCYVRNASSGVVVPYTACVVCLLFLYRSPSRYYYLFSHCCQTCVAGDALALSCGADWLWTLCRLRVVAWTRHLGYNTLYHSGRLAYFFSSLEGPMNVANRK